MAPKLGRVAPAIALLGVLVVLNLAAVIHEGIWFAAVGAFLLLELVMFTVGLERNAPADHGQADPAARRR